MINVKPGRPLDRDRLFMLPRDKVADTAHLALFGIQDEPPEPMVAGAAMLFYVMCHRTGVDPEDMVNMAKRVLGDQQYHGRTNKSLQSLRDFAGLRVAGDEVVVS